ncbi:glycosyltransferase [Chitinibacteraceae bacterium HSL-7]
MTVREYTYDFKFQENSVYANVVSLIGSQDGVHVDLGCGFGAVAEPISQMGLKYIGLDANPVAVDALLQRGFAAFQVDLSDLDRVLAVLTDIQREERVASISAIDVIEHLDDPVGFLTAIRRALRKPARLVLSVPNFSHFDVASKLLAGKWEETEAGILDYTHRHVYTETKLCHVATSAGWQENAQSDYALECTEQYENGFILHNRDVGLGGVLREIASAVNKNSAVYQFVRAYEVCAVDIPETAQNLYAHNFALTVICTGDAQGESELLPGTQVISLPCDSETGLNGEVNEYLFSLLAKVHGDYIILCSSHKGVVEPILQALNEARARFNACPVFEFVSGAVGEVNVFPLEAMKDFPKSLAGRIIAFPRRSLELFNWGESIGESFSQNLYSACVLFGYAQVGVPLTEELVEDRSHSGTCDNSDVSGIARLNGLSAELLRIGRELEEERKNSFVLNELLSQRQQEILQLQGSVSWRVTRPLRFIRSLPDRGRVAARRLYQCSSVMPRIRYRLSALWQRVMRGCLEIASNADENMRALNALSERRSMHVRDSPESAVAGVEEIDISVVMYNSQAWMELFFASLVSQGYPTNCINLILVDNSSTDATVAVASKLIDRFGEKFKSARLLSQPNSGFGSGHDAAIAVSKSKYVLIANVDLEFEPDSIVELMKLAMQAGQEDVASWELRQIPYEHPKYYDPVTLETNWSSHACVLLRRSAYEQVGGYEPRIFMYAEDVELSYRFRSYGYRLKYCPQAVVKHYSYDEAGQVKPLQFSGSTLGNAYVRLRYGGWRDRIGILPLYLGLLVWPAPYAGAKKAVIQNLGLIVKNYSWMRRGRGGVSVNFPFRMFDYEMIRQGAFYPISRCISGPLVSIVVRTYQGRERFLREALASIRNQTYLKIETIVVEDGGDKMRPIAMLAHDEQRPVRFFSCDKVGRSVTGNRGLAESQGEYIMFLDDDDLLFPDHVEVLMQTLQDSPELDAAYSLALQVCTRRVGDGYVEERFESVPAFEQEWDYSVLDDHNFMPIQAVLFHRRLYQRWGGFETDMEQLEDWNLWLRYGYKARFKYVAKTTSLFRVPADDAVRMDRHLALHAAYGTARARAKHRIAQMT